MYVGRREDEGWRQKGRIGEGGEEAGEGEAGRKNEMEKTVLVCFVLVLNVVSNRCLRLKWLHYFKYAKDNIQIMIAFECIQIVEMVMMRPPLPIMRKTISSYPSCLNKPEMRINEMLEMLHCGLCILRKKRACGPRGLHQSAPTSSHPSATETLSSKYCLQIPGCD